MLESSRRSVSWVYNYCLNSHDRVSRTQPHFGMRRLGGWISQRLWKLSQVGCWTASFIDQVVSGLDLPFKMLGQ